MRPYVIFFATFWFFASHPHLTLFVFVVLLFLFFKFSLSLPSSLCSVAVSISCFMQTKKQKIQISRHVMFYNLSYRYVRGCMHTYLFFIATVYKYIYVYFGYCYCVAFWQYDVFFWRVLFLLLWF